MEFTLADALQHYHAIDESVHRIWGYLGIVAAGLIAYVATPERGVPRVRVIAAMVAFALFASVNGVILYLDEADLYQAAATIRTAAASLKDQPFRSMLEGIRPFSPEFAVFGHFLIDLGTLAILWRFQRVRANV